MNLNFTMIGQSVIFLVFLWFCWQYVWPHILNAMKEREAKIAEGLNNAERADHELELAQKKAVKILSDAKSQAAEIVDSANKRATQIVEEGQASGQAEGERMKAAAQAEIELETSRAREELRGKVAALVIEGAEKVIESEVDASAHADLLKKLSEKL